MARTHTSGYDRYRLLRKRPLPPIPVIHCWVRLAALESGYAVEDLLSARRTRSVCEARWMAMQLLADDGLSLCAIARAVHRRDHTTVTSGLAQVAASPALQARVARVRALWKDMAS